MDQPQKKKLSNLIRHTTVLETKVKNGEAEGTKMWIRRKLNERKNHNDRPSKNLATYLRAARGLRLPKKGQNSREQESSCKITRMGKLMPNYGLKYRTSYKGLKNYTFKKRKDLPNEYFEKEENWSFKICEMC